jgi:hypothetical protein
MTGAANAAANQVYLYGLTRISTSEPPILAVGGGVVAGRPVRFLHVGSLVAIISIFPAGSFARETGVSEDEWAKSRAVAHHKVLAGLAGRLPLVPSKFGTVLQSVDSLAAFLTQNAAALEKTLDHVAGCREWGLKLFGDPNISHVMAQSDPALAPLREELTSASAGKAYFIRKKLQLAADAEAQRILTSRAIEVHQALTSIARESANVRRSRGPKPASRENIPVMLLNAAYLVETSRETQFHEALAGMQRSFAESGLSDVLTGPWPPYNFVSPLAKETANV